MFGLAGYAVRGPAQGALVASSTLLLSMMIPPLVVFSGAVVALVWLRKGPRDGAVVALLGLAVAALIARLSGIGPLAPLVVAVSCWVPALVMAAVLRHTVTLSLAMLSGASLAILAAIAVHMAIADPAAEWRAFFSALFNNAEVSEQLQLGGNEEVWQEFLAKTSEYMTGIYCSMLFLMAAFSVLLARGWQARLFNPGGLQKEFHALRYGKTMSIAGAVVLAVAMFLQLPIAKTIAIVVIAVFAFQGMAVIHALVAGKGLSVGWLVLIYIIGLIKVEAVLAIGLVGIADAWINFRQRFIKTA
jgi:uncharacterized protein YybS (DUF2232 family)